MEAEIDNVGINHGKIALAKVRRIANGDIPTTDPRVNPIAASLGISLNGNLVTENETTDRLDDLEDEIVSLGGHNSSHLLHGVLSGMDVSINTDPRYFDIAAGVYYINGTRVQYSGGTIDTLTILGGQFASATIDVSGDVSLMPNLFPTYLELENKLEITAFTKIDPNTIGNIGNSFFVALDFIKKIYLRNKLFEGTIFSRTTGKISINTTNSLQLDIKGGYINTPNAETKEIIEQIGLMAHKMYNISGEYYIDPVSSLLTVDILQYDDGTDLALTPNNKYVTHTLSRSSRTEGIYFTYAKEYFNQQSEAESAEFDLGPFNNSLGSEVEPLAIIIVEQATGIVTIIDIRNSVSRNT